MGKSKPKTDQEIEAILNKRARHKPLKFTVELNYSEAKSLYYYQRDMYYRHNGIETSLKDSIQFLIVKALRDREFWVSL